MSIKGLDRSGSLFFLAFLSVFAALISFIKKVNCGSWHCSYIFLILALVFFLWAWQSAR